MEKFDPKLAVSTKYLGREEKHVDLSYGLKSGEFLVTTKQYSDDNTKTPIKKMSYTKQEIL